MNMGSLSEMMILRMSCNLHISVKNSVATVIALNLLCNGMKCAYLVNLSMTTNIVDFLVSLGNPIMKFIAISSQIVEGICGGFNSPIGIWFTFRLLAYRAHVDKVFNISLYIGLEKLR